LVDRDQRPKIRLSVRPARSASVDTTRVDDGWAEDTDVVDHVPSLDDESFISAPPGEGSGRRTAVPGELHRDDLESDTDVLRRGVQAPSPVHRPRAEKARSILQSSVGEAMIADDGSIDIEAPPQSAQSVDTVESFADETPLHLEPPPLAAFAPVQEPPRAPPPRAAPSGPQSVGSPASHSAPSHGARSQPRKVVQLGQALAVLVPFAGTRVPLWSLLGAAIVTTAFACGLAALVLFGASAVSNAEPTSSAAPPPSESPPTSLSAKAIGGDASAIQTLREKAERDSNEVVAVSLGEVAAKRNELADLQKRIAEDPKLARDPKIIAQLRKRAYDADVYREAQQLIAGLEGDLAADLLYAVWTGTVARTDATELAQGLVYSQDVRAKASAALAVAIDLRRATSCEQRKEILARSIQYGDQRSLGQLALLRSKAGCGPKKTDDCHACLRADGALEEAIQAVSRRAPPNL
jgi:hypothetical protein